MPSILHVSHNRDVSGATELIPAEIASLARRGVEADWAVAAVGSRAKTGTYALRRALCGDADVRLDAGAVQKAIDSYIDDNASHIEVAGASFDIIVLHAGLAVTLAPRLRSTGATLVWRCHTGHDVMNAGLRTAQRLLAPYVSAVDHMIFPSVASSWPPLDGPRSTVIPPGLDVGSWKNRDLDPALSAEWWAGLSQGREITLPLGDPHAGEVATVRFDDRGTGFLESEGSPFLACVSRWDPLKGQAGLVAGFAGLAERRPELELVLVGPYVDPGRRGPDTASEYLRRLGAARLELPADVRRRLHLWQIVPSRKEAEDLAINLVQRRARVILQNSHREAYGLTVSEAMWKGAVVVASKVGGIPERLRHDHNGLLTRDTTGGADWVATVDRALRDADGRSRWSAAARRTIEDGHLLEDSVTRQLDLFAR
jgi:trehalose synthase